MGSSGDKRGTPHKTEKVAIAYSSCVTFLFPTVCRHAHLVSPNVSTLIVREYAEAASKCCCQLQAQARASAGLVAAATGSTCNTNTCAWLGCGLQRYLSAPDCTSAPPHPILNTIQLHWQEKLTGVCCVPGALLCQLQCALRWYTAVSTARTTVPLVGSGPSKGFAKATSSQGIVHP